MADEPQEPRHLTVVKPTKKKTPPAVEAAGDILAEARRWWDAQNLTEMATMATLGQAFADVGMLSLAWIAKRLVNPKTPDRVKDVLARTIAPKVHVNINAGGKKRSGKATADVLAGYDIE